MSENEFVIELKKIGIVLTDHQKELFRIYATYLLEYNEHTNLTAIRIIDDVYLKHFYDSALLLKYIRFDKERILDIGCGAGFPGVVLKILCPNIDLYCLDSNGKKTKFLESLKSKLGIEYNVINKRAEEYVKETRESFDMVTSRAVSSMPVLSELSIPFVKIDGLFIAYKGNLDDTIENGIFAIETLGGKVKKIYQDELIHDSGMRNFVVVQKLCKTDECYPRLFDKINKKPLQKLTK